MGTAVDLRNFYHCTACYPVDRVLDTLTSSASDRSCIYNSVQKLLVLVLFKLLIYGCVSNFQ